jgi:shikimate dehydrogenase
MTRYIGIVGYPLKHSISSVFQQAVLDYYGLDIRYEKWETPTEQLGSVVERLHRPDYLGANVTLPYKEVALSLMDEVDDLAGRIGAVNTIVNQNSRLVGYNTDAAAFLKALREDGGFEPRDKRVMLLGAGGVARAAGFALVEAGVSTLVIANRSSHRSEELASALGKGLEPRQEVAILPWGAPYMGQWLARCQLLVNCTSVGMRHSSTEGESPLDPKFIPGDALVYDLVYNPMETPLLAGARERGAITLGGLPMLIYQGAAAFELWTGREGLVDIMLEAAKKVLQGEE